MKTTSRIYLDTCCYNRLFDNAAQQRIFDERSAIASIINRGRSGEVCIVGSEVLRLEIDNITDSLKHFQVLTSYLQTVTEVISVSGEILNLAARITAQTHIKKFDALHLACALLGRIDALLTTDDRFLKLCGRLKLQTRVLNPVTYLAEVILC